MLGPTDGQSRAMVVPRKAAPPHWLLRRKLGRHPVLHHHAAAGGAECRGRVGIERDGKPDGRQHGPRQSRRCARGRSIVGRCDRAGGSAGRGRPGSAEHRFPTIRTRCSPRSPIHAPRSSSRTTRRRCCLGSTKCRRFSRPGSPDRRTPTSWRGCCSASPIP